MGSTPESKGEYFEEETPQEGKISVMWTEGLEQLMMYAFDPEAQEITIAPRMMTTNIHTDTGVESQDSGLGYAELEPRKKINPRDPRCRSLTLAPPSTLYGKDNLPGPSSSNVAQPTLSISRATDFLMEEGNREPRLVIDIVT